MANYQLLAVTLASQGWAHVAGTNVRAHEIPGRLSDSPLWQIESASGVFALRGWSADHIQQAALAHRLLSHVERSRAGWTPCPLPVAEGHGTLFTSPDGMHWELAPWLPGEAEFESHSSDTRLNAACRSLAEFHLLACKLSVDATDHSAIKRHLHQLDRLTTELAAGVFANVKRSRKSFHDVLCEGAKIGRQQLTPLYGLALPRQCCWGDAWHNNFLFAGDKVSGLVDFATVRVDTPTADLARLLGSATAEHFDWWQPGLEAYAAVRPLTVAERQATEALDTSGAVLSLANWVRWLRIEGRTFRDQAKAHDRLQHFDRRLEQMLG
jgi:Ser/Thr protein kinase RdoA (MazF antagonist)